MTAFQTFKDTSHCSSKIETCLGGHPWGQFGSTLGTIRDVFGTTRDIFLVKLGQLRIQFGPTLGSIWVIYVVHLNIRVISRVNRDQV